MAKSLHPLHVSFRVDSGTEIGTGHLMRCLTLADALAERGHRCSFITRPHPGNRTELIEAHGHARHSLAAPLNTNYGAHGSPPPHKTWLQAGWQEDALATRNILTTLQPDWLVVDHYALDNKWDTSALLDTTQLLVIDDLADRPHACDILLDQNLGRSKTDYNGLVSPSCKRLIGPQYALLRPEFCQHRAESLKRRQHPLLRHILITMGGVDKDNTAGRVLESLADCMPPQTEQISVVIGAGSPSRGPVERIAASMLVPTRVLINVSNMAEIMASADLAIGAAGSTSWERCCLGLPTLVFELADNQKEAALAVEKVGAAVRMGDICSLMNLTDRLTKTMDKLDTHALNKLARNACAAVDGGGTSRCVFIIEKMSS